MCNNTTVNPEPIIEPDDEDFASSSSSLRSSILSYRQENGRTYHQYKDGSKATFAVDLIDQVLIRRLEYNMPNDDLECERLDLQHHLFILTLDGRLGLAPPNDPDSNVKRVLDVGTGTGIWAVDFGDEHPKAQVIGVDLSPIQPSFVPPNVEFFVDDIEEPWSFSQPFDYIHSRMMTFSIKSWPEYIRKIYDNLTPGGYVELVEIDLQNKSDDGTLKEHHELSRLVRLLDEASTKIGRRFQDNKKNKDILRDTGFVDIVETTFKWPSGPWPREKKYKELGQWTNANMDAFQGLEALVMAAFTRVLGWTQEEVVVHLAMVRKEISDKRIHAYWTIYSTYGRRPLE
ncbi:hypothetical protein MRS44_004206 [Fusarium solani]|uniref:uncharacterized protein n=1 Tax=Fusarium solani TaxID=169388 RepID=UPI0032C46502|nr:hypothetical protein MRS44_004206 [Fusarium solani]